ncbi:MAG TPA: class I SAM-dependent methyltransferase [Thermoleophilaceae bacterium]|nr:class I SAM-dependent methyltransferase [Thermoleophilaceae bacterium]
MTWDATTYEKVADPQSAWADEIIARSGIRHGDVVLDAGCGGGRVTRKLLELTPNVIAVDADSNMVAKARASLPESVPVHHQDLLALDIDQRVDVVFSCAVFHWITDHGRLFERLHAVLKPGGRLVAQCGGHGNIQNVLDIVGERPGRWLYANPEDTEDRLQAAGFSQARAWLEPKPTVPSDMVAFVETVILHKDPDRHANAERVAAQVDHLDYVRLNMEATA